MEKKPNSEKNAFSGFQKAYNPHLKKNKIAKKPQEADKEANLEKALIIKPEKEKISKKIEKELEDYKTKMK